jgi:thiol-disulfide isomerase/thioredoxin
VIAALGWFWVMAACSATSQETEFTTPPPAEAPAMDGLVYPVDNVGPLPRRGKTRGNRIANLQFWGYANGDTSAPLGGLSLARYYDPEAKRSKLLHVFVAAGWCPICRGEAASLSSAYGRLNSEGVVVLSIVVNGARQNVGPSLNELSAWGSAHPMRPGADLALDQRGRSFGDFAINGVPWNALIDVRTMEIVAIAEGAPRDIAAWDQAGLDWVITHPPSYPPP